MKTNNSQRSLHELQILVLLAERSVRAMEVRYPNIDPGDRQLKAIALTKSLCTAYDVEPPPLAIEICCEAALFDIPPIETTAERDIEDIPEAPRDWVLPEGGSSLLPKRNPW